MRKRIIILLMVLTLMTIGLVVYAHAEGTDWHEECHTIDGHTECASHLWGCVKFCGDR